jgi:integrase
VDGAGDQNEGRQEPSGAPERAGIDDPVRGSGNSYSSGKPLSQMAMAMVLRRMGHPELTVHGFRSSFTDWAAETTSFPHEVCEMALAHTISDKVERAYRRGDLFEKRRQLMRAWADYLALTAPNEPI